MAMARHWIHVTAQETRMSGKGRQTRWPARSTWFKSGSASSRRRRSPGSSASGSSAGQGRKVAPCDWLECPSAKAGKGRGSSTQISSAQRVESVGVAPCSQENIAPLRPIFSRFSCSFLNLDRQLRWTWDYARREVERRELSSRPCRQTECLTNTGICL